MDIFRTALLGELVKLGAAPRSVLTPQSSNVRGYSYDPASQALTVTYHSGGTYRYDGVPPTAARSLGRSKSVGKAVNRLIKTPGYSYEKVSNVIESFTKARRSIEKLAGVAKKQVTVNGLTMKIEYEPGDIRKGTSRDGKTWTRKMYASYGYVPGTKGKAADGDAIDVYVAPAPEDGPVYEIEQQKKDDGSYDESKFMIGWPSADAAKKAYLQHMPQWAFGSIKEVAANARGFATSLNGLAKAAGSAEYGVMGGLSAGGAMPASPKPTTPKSPQTAAAAPKMQPPPKPVAPTSVPPASTLGQPAVAPTPMKKTSMPAMGYRRSMNMQSYFLTGFTNELVKEGAHPLIKTVQRGGSMLGQKVKSMVGKVIKRGKKLRATTKGGNGLKGVLKMKKKASYEDENGEGGIVSDSSDAGDSADAGEILRAILEEAQARVGDGGGYTDETESNEPSYGSGKGLRGKPINKPVSKKPKPTSGKAKNPMIRAAPKY